jgi:hypothetical protein
MSRPIDRLLQECLEAYEAGLQPEECLARFPQSRAQLEPLLRQAISLRVAFAATPREEFRSAGRETLMFAAGRDLRAAFQAEPDPAFKNLARYRLLQAAGSGVQEALRDVPPPCLPFWVNARRHLLEASSQPRPKSPSSGEFALRVSLSMAVALLAIALGVVLFLAAKTTPSAAEELAKLEQQIDSIEEKARTGQTVNANELQRLSQKTKELATKVDAEAPEARRLADAIDRQQEVVSQVHVEPQASLVIVLTRQLLNDAEEEVVAAGATASATPQATGTSQASPTPAATPSPTPVDLGDNQVRIRLDTTDNAWRTVQTNKISLVLPADWQIVGVQPNEHGIAVLSSGVVAIIVPGETSTGIDVDVSTGGVTALMNGQTVTLRRPGVDGTVLPPEELAGLTDAQRALLLARFLTSIELH